MSIANELLGPTNVQFSDWILGKALNLIPIPGNIRVSGLSRWCQGYPTCCCILEPMGHEDNGDALCNFMSDYNCRSSVNTSAAVWYQVWPTLRRDRDML